MKKRGINYVSTLPIKAIILFIKSQLIILIYLATNIFILKNQITLKRYILSVIFKSGLGNSNWFAFTIIVLYLYSYLSFRFIKNKISFGILILCFLCFLHVIFVFKYFYPKQYYTVDTVLCFISGFIFSFVKNHLDKVMIKNDIYYYMITSITIMFYNKTFTNNNLINISIKNSLFALLIVFISMKIKFNNDFLKFLNSHSYSIYLLQRVVMMVTNKNRYFRDNNFIQISFEFTSIFFLSSFFDKSTAFIDKMFNKKLNISSTINLILILIIVLILII